MTHANMTPLRAAARGVVAAAVGTLALDVLGYVRYKRAGGESSFLDWDLSVGLDKWDAASAPAQVGKRLYEGLLQQELPAEKASLTNNVMHWSYGLSWGAEYGIVAGSFGPPGFWAGLPFGLAVWLASYVVLPLAKLYKPIWEYDMPTLWKDLSGHLVYGVTTAAVFHLLARR